MHSRYPRNSYQSSWAPNICECPRRFWTFPESSCTFSCNFQSLPRNNLFEIVELSFNVCRFFHSYGKFNRFRWFYEKIKAFLRFNFLTFSIIGHIWPLATYLDSTVVCMWFSGRQSTLRLRDTDQLPMFLRVFYVKNRTLHIYYKKRLAHALREAFRFKHPLLHAAYIIYREIARRSIDKKYVMRARSTIIAMVAEERGQPRWKKRKKSDNKSFPF